MTQFTGGSGPDVARLVSEATTNATVAKASPGRLFGWVASNTNAAARYLKVYDKATAPTVGTDVPVLTVMLPVGGVAAYDMREGIVFTRGISFALTAGAADADTAAVGAAESLVNLFIR
jgi:hypothetical protein